MENVCSNHGVVKEYLLIPAGWMLDEKGAIVETIKPEYIAPVPVAKKPIKKKYKSLAKEIEFAIRQQESAAEEYIQEYNNQEDADVCFAKVEAYNSALDLLREK